MVLYCVAGYDALQSTMGMEVRKQRNILWVNVDGCKEVIGMYVSVSEGANFWMNALAQIRYRGVKRIFKDSDREPERVLRNH